MESMTWMNKAANLHVACIPSRQEADTMHDTHAN